MTDYKEAAQYCYEGYHAAISRHNPHASVTWDQLTAYEQDAWREGVYAAMRGSWFTGVQKGKRKWSRKATPSGKST
jgi:hypothetical protein